VAFPLWNINSLVGLFWGWFLFNELRGAGARQSMKVLGGVFAIVLGACLLAYASGQHGIESPHRAAAGILAALGAGLLWGTMYIPYRKAYISGMNPLSFVTVFAVGELFTMSALALVFHGGLAPLLQELARARPALLWLFMGGFCWVLGDLFQQYAAKYSGGFPLAGTRSATPPYGDKRFLDGTACPRHAGLSRRLRQANLETHKVLVAPGARVRGPDKTMPGDPLTRLRAVAGCAP
jgi:drug/metabolite transporter (DMT)-like permease